MTQKLRIKCPYAVGDNYRVLMNVYYDELGQPIEQIKLKQKVLNIEAVEIFTEVLDENKHDNPEERASLFLSTIAGQSQLTFRKQEVGKPAWTANWDVGEPYPFSAGVKLATQIRCSLLKGDDPHIELKFEFDYPKIATTIQTEYLRKLDSNFSGLEVPETGDAQKFELVLRKFHVIDNAANNRPHLLDFGSFLAKGALKGISVWQIRYDKLFMAASGKTNAKKSGLVIEYAHRPSTSGSWGQTEADATRIQPLGLAPVGVPNSYYDFTLTSALASDTVERSARSSDLVWKFRVLSAFNASHDEMSFGPYSVWNRFFAGPYAVALGTVKGGTPGSIVPFFQSTVTPAGQTALWFFDYDLRDVAAHAAGNVDEDQFRFRFRQFGLIENSSLKVHARFPRFLDHEARPVKRTLQLSHGTEDDVTLSNQDVESSENTETAPLIRLRVKDLANANVAPEQQCRVGALDLHYALPADNPTPGDSFEGTLRASLRGLSEVDPTSDQQLQLGLPEFHATFYLHLAALSPGGQDPLPEELTIYENRLPSTLVVPTSDKDVQQSDVIRGPFVLIASENSYDVVNQTLALRLENNGSSVGTDPPIDFIVLDPQPFLVARVRAGLNFGSEVGNWDDADPRGAFWELSDDGKGFDFILPPQIVGEEFIKDYADFDPAKPLFYRFSQPAHFVLQRTAVRQNFSEAPWNLRRMFGLLSGGTPGVTINSADFELLYGLTTNITTDFLRLAELDARMGHLPGLLGRNSPLRVVDPNQGQPVDPENDPFVNAYRKEWSGFSSQKKLALSRVACLHPAKLAQKGSVLTLDSGVSFHFRNSRKVAHPTGKNTGIFLPPEQGGLRGGVDWGFESFNVHTEVINSGPSTSGQLVDPWFTSLGGSGYQKAGFANDKSTILSNAFVGRIFFYSLQRIGRVNMLWNTAKHVIIYERTVADTLDNKDTPAGKPEGRWRGRPVVRKVEEYVEVLQSERNYPEFGAAPKTRGFILGSRFPKQTKIHVKSSWGRDIPGGWIVPLYNPAAVSAMTDPEEKELYNRPEVKLSFATSEETGRAHTPATVTNPEILYFYTSTDPQMGKDTDTWPAVPVIDFPLETIPKAPAAPPAGATDAVLPDPPRHEGGYDQYTLYLDTSGQTANLLADRIDASTEALIENVSMVRRSLKEWTPKVIDPSRQQLAEIIDKSNGYADALTRKAGDVVSGLGSNYAEIKRQIDSFAAEAATQLNNIRLVYSSAPPTKDVIVETQARLTTLWHKTWDDFTINTKRRIVTELVAGEARMEQQKELIFREIERQVVSVESALTELQQGLQRVTERITAAQIQFIAARTDIEDQIRDALVRINAAKQDDLSLLTGEIERYTSLATAASGLLQNNIQSMKRQMEPYFPTLPATDNASIDVWLNVQPISIGLIEEVFSPELLADLRDPAIEIDVDAYMLDIQAALDEILTILTPLEEFEDEDLKVRGLLNDAFNSVKQQIDKLQSEFFVNFDAMLKGALDRVKAMSLLPLADLQAKFEGEMGEIAKLVQNDYFTKARAAIDTLEPQIKAISGDLKSIEKSIQREIDFAKGVTETLRKRLADENIRLTNELRQALSGTTSSLFSTVSSALAPFEQQIREQARHFDLTHLNDEVQNLGDKTLRMVRAYGLAPIAEAMKLNRDRLAYYFDEAKREIDFTPATVLVNRIGRELENVDLKSLSLRLPSRSLAEKFLSEELANLPIGAVIPGCGGFNNEVLFPGGLLPPYAKDAIKITHGINRETRQAWAKCDLALDLSDRVDVFELGPVKVTLVKPHFEAHSEIAVDEQGHVQRKVEAFISGDWHLIIMGEPVLMLVECALRYNNNGKISFDLKPSSVRLPQALKFLTDLVKSFRPGKASGLSFELVLDNGFPVGARAVLNLPMPPLQTGAFAVSHIALRSRFEIAAPNGQFYLGVGFSICSRERPFTLTILCLGGGGWIDALAVYKPFAESGKLSARLSIGLAAGADFAFDIGVAAGGVYFLVSLYAEFTFGAGGGMRIALRVAVGGEVVVLGFISVCIDLYLEASYQSGGSLKCTGELSLSIEICWCFTLEVHQQVEFTLAGKDGSSSRFMDEKTTVALAAKPEYTDNISAAVDNYFAAYGA